MAGVTQKNGKTCPQSHRGFWRCRGGGTWCHRLSSWRLFFHVHENCALSEYPKSADCFNDIFEKRDQFWAGSPREMTKKLNNIKSTFLWHCTQPANALRQQMHTETTTAEERTGTRRANTKFTNCPMTSIRVLVPKKILISGGQRIPGDQRHVFLWAVKTLHGANLNNQCRKERYFAVSQSK